MHIITALQTPQCHEPCHAVCSVANNVFRKFFFRIEFWYCTGTVAQFHFMLDDLPRCDHSFLGNPHKVNVYDWWCGRLQPMWFPLVLYSLVFGHQDYIRSGVFYGLSCWNWNIRRHASFFFHKHMKKRFFFAILC